MFARASCSQLKCVTHAAFYAVCRIYASLRCYFLWSTFSQYTAFANIWPFSVFANHNEVMRRGVPRCRACKRSTIDVQVQLKAHLEQKSTLNNTGRHARSTHSAKQDGIKVAQLRKRLVRQHLTVAQIPRATQIKIGCLKLRTSSTQYFERLNDNFGANAVTTNDCNAMLLARW